MKFENLIIQNCDVGVHFYEGNGELNMTFISNAGAILASPTSTVIITFSYFAFNKLCAIILYDSTLHISTSQINDNRIPGFRGGIYSNHSNIVASDCWFLRNSASFRSEFSISTFTSCHFEDNFGLDMGGVMKLNSDTTNIHNCTFINNTASRGGVIYALGTSNLTITNSSYSNNHASTHGGVFELDNYTTLNISTSSFQFNTAQRGGVVFSNYSNFEIYSSIFFNNSADLEGGAIFSNYSSLLAQNCAFGSKSALDGGGIYIGGNATGILICNVFCLIYFYNYCFLME